MTAAPRVQSRRIPPSVVFIYAGFLVALIYLLIVQLGPTASIYATAPPPGVDLLRKIDSLVAAASNGHAVQFHALVSTQDWQNNGAFLARIYFSAVYHQYPSPILIGDGRSIINFPVQLQQADHVETDPWLHDHQISSVVTLIPGDQSNWHMTIGAIRSPLDVTLLPGDQGNWHVLIHRVP